MSPACELLGAFFDGELEPPDARAFRAHLAGCDACDQALHELMVLEALEDTHRPALREAPPPSNRAPARGRFARRLGPLLSSFAIAAVVAGFVARRALVAPAPPAPPAVTLATQPERSVAVRFTYPPADVYRPYGVERGSAGAHDDVSMAVLARLEEAKEYRGIAAALVLSGDPRRAEPFLDKAEATPDAAVDRAALAIEEGHPELAIDRLAPVLAKEPGHPQALWNEALALEALHLPYVAAEAWASVAARDEPGWSAEAKRRGDDLVRADDEQRRAWKELTDALRALVSRGTPPPPALVDAHPSNVRGALYDAMNAAPSRERLEALRPLASRLDGGDPRGPLLRHIARLAARGFAKRRALVARYVALLEDGPVSDDVEAFVEELRRAGEEELFFGAVDRAYLWREHAAELARIAKAHDDPWMRLVAERGAAKVLEAQGKYGEAERTFRDAVVACDALRYGALCARLEYQRVLDLWRAHRVREAEHAAVQAFARADADSNPVNYMLRTVLAKSAVQRGDHALARAYAFDAMLREPSFCTGRADAYEIAAESYLDALDPAAAKRELAKGPQCDGTYEPARARALVVLARSGERLPETDDLEKAVADGFPTWTEGQRLFMDAVHGNLLLASRPADGEALLRATVQRARAIAANADAKAALDWSLVSLGWQAARRGDGAAVMAMFTEQAGLADARCTVVVGVDYERTMAVVEDGAGGIVARAEEHAPRSPPSPSDLFPSGAIDALRACPEVRVIASAPVHGMPRLLPGDVAWSYRVATPRAADGPASPPRALVVSNVEPPAELGLPPLLGFTPRDPAPGVPTTWLRGQQATVSNVLRELATASEVQIHTHGLADIGESDAPLLVLSPEPSGAWSLSSNDIASVRLEGRPVVILGACNAARAPSSLHEQWSLPAAFLRAGARSVIAAAEAIPDGPAAAFFEGVLRRVRTGAPPAVALRDERAAWRDRRDAGWIDDVLLFQ